MVPVPDSEVITLTDIDEIIEFNRQLVEASGEIKDPWFEEVNRPLLERVFERMSIYNNIRDTRQRVIKKATHIVTGITRSQAFFEANKRTSLLAIYPYLERNGLPIVIPDIDDLEVYNLLNGIIMQPSKFDRIFVEIEEYISRRIIQ